MPSLIRMHAYAMTADPWVRLFCEYHYIQGGLSSNYTTYRIILFG